MRHHVSVCFLGEQGWLKYISCFWDLFPFLSKLETWLYVCFFFMKDLFSIFSVRLSLLLSRDSYLFKIWSIKIYNQHYWKLISWAYWRFIHFQLQTFLFSWTLCCYLRRKSPCEDLYLKIKYLLYMRVLFEYEYLYFVHSILG